MKIHREDDGFIPISIVLESQEEVDQLTALLGLGVGNITASTSSLYNKLYEYVDEESYDAVFREYVDYYKKGI